MGARALSSRRASARHLADAVLIFEGSRASRRGALAVFQPGSKVVMFVVVREVRILVTLKVIPSPSRISMIK